MATRIHPHSPLPAPALHANHASNQSKSHVLAGVQDAYWSDDEAEDAECPLCLEEMDISDLNFKPCPCGYQICRFCWHHIKENLNGRCPACRREYTDETVQFKPINKEDHKRLTQQKKQRERERKELDALGRRQLANVRVVQRNVVYVVGIGPRFAKEELIPTLRSNEYFGQYGKISKIVIVKRTPPGGRAPVVGLYITYHRREDAARVIAAVDGAPSPSGGQEIMRASYGTTKYCMAFLRGVNCTDHGCMNLHEWGDEKDCFTKEDLTTLKHTMKDTETRIRTTTVSKKPDENDAALPRGASWATKGANTLTSTALHNNSSASIPLLASARQARRGERSSTSTRQQRSGSTTTPTPSATTVESRSSARDRKSATKTPSQVSTSRPTTPAGNRPVTPASAARAQKQKEPVPPVPQPPRSPTSSVTPESESGSAGQEAASPSPAPQVTAPQTPALPPGIPAVPPGLAPPPGLPAPNRAAQDGASLQISMQPSQSSYQMSTQAQALMEDIKARREMPAAASAQSPFPDFDRMLQTLSGGDGDFGGFSFNLDPKLAGEEQEALPDFDPTIPFNGTFLDAFPGLRQAGPSSTPLMPPPGLSYPQHTARPVFDPLSMRQQSLERQSTGSSYTGSFNPFAAETTEDTPVRRYSPLLDEERKVSRFGFARGRQGSTSSPHHVASPLSESASHFSNYYNVSEHASPATHAPPQWPFNARHEFAHHQTVSNSSSPLVQHAQAQTMYAQQQPSRFQPFDTGVSEAQLRDLITSSRERANASRNGPPEQAPFKYSHNQGQPFNDPAIMSARMASPIMQQGVHNAGFGNSGPSDNFTSPQVAYGPPPGLAFAESAAASPLTQQTFGSGMVSAPSTSMDVSQTSGSAHVSTSASPSPSPALSSSDFPALTAAEPQARREQAVESATPSPAPTVDDATQAKAERKAAKKAAAEARAAERARIAQEKAAAKAVEKERLAQEKAAEKERVAALKAEKEKAAKEKAEKEKADKEQAERDRLERLEKEKAARELAEKAKAEKEQAKATAAAAARAKTGKAMTVAVKAKADQPSGAIDIEKTPAKRGQAKQAAPAPHPVDSVTQVPILSKMPKKNKPITKPIRIPKEEPVPEAASALPSATPSDAPQLPDGRVTESSSNNSRAQSVDPSIPSQPVSVKELLAEIDTEAPWMNMSKHPFFDLQKINPAAKMPLEYGPLVHALSALSVGGGSFANNMPSGSIDNAVSSFQQLLETLTQTISDLLRLLPRKTWDDNSSFDGVLRDMLKGDDFLENAGEDQNGQGKEDEVAALTLALERRARWMEVQLSKLEELHRDINTAAVRAVLAFNDNGWDVHGFMPRVGNTLQRFDQIGMVKEEGGMRPMTADELEKKLVVAKEAAIFAEAELREIMKKMQGLKPVHEDEY
ncbi:hypothetical protein CERSUDRAFT_117303 [Gelatoporia subvermispora B]|uniref:RING-type domain-containing protein n=1 Tax=Ceriporiopsis subvermispora (strain B) TaxID=914234 RepID=M2PEY2_CERS8|nr:hypothetical protein CERSUDRAFT_117303 [Gelatoporia subvermispora B]